MLKYSYDNPAPFEVAIFHDADIIAPALNRGLRMRGFNNRLFYSHDQLLRVALVENYRFTSLTDLDEVQVALVHKDLFYDGMMPNGAETIIQLLHEYEPRIRIGIVSGEYPDGLNHAIEIKGDFYMMPRFVTDEPFGLDQLQKGYISEEEMNDRGKKIWTPEGLLMPRSGRERFQW